MSSAALTSTAFIATVEPARIILRLCKHWGHKWPVQYDEQHGRIGPPARTGGKEIVDGHGQVVVWI